MKESMTIDEHYQEALKDKETKPDTDHGFDIGTEEHSETGSLREDENHMIILVYRRRKGWLLKMIVLQR